jgi:hypothetical protein
MPRPALLLVLLTGPTGCLTIPPPSSTGDDDASVIDATGSDAGINLCGNRDAYTGMPFPPAGVDLGLRQASAADVNRDGADDILLANAPADDADWGVFVLLGPQSNAAALEFHAFVHTNVIPWTLYVGDVITDEASNCLDFAVFGENAAGNAGLVEIHEMTGPTEMYGGTPLSKDIGFVPAGADAPVLLTFGDFGGSGYGLDFFAADLDDMRMVQVDSSLEFGLPTAVPRSVGRMGTPGVWTDINALFTRPGLSGNGDDLVVIEQFGLTWMENDGSGDFSVTPPTAAPTGEFVSRAIQIADVDTMPSFDYVGGAGTDFGAYLIEIDGTDLTVTPRGWNPGLPVYNQLDSLAVVDLGGSTQPEVVVLERDEPSLTMPAKVMVIEDLFDGGTELLPMTVSPPLEFIDGLDPWQLLVVDFDDDVSPEVWAFDQDGGIACVQLATGGGGMVLCP